MMTLDLSAPHQVYKNKLGVTLPGVTTVLGTLNKEAIPPWYAQMEREGILTFMGGMSWTAAELRDLLPKTKDGTKPAWFAVQKRDKAADLGNITHGRIEAWLHDTVLDPAGLPAYLYAQSDLGLNRFIQYWHERGLRAEQTELQMVSELLQVGGTGDIFARTAGGVLVYADLKTTKASTYWPYDESIAQVSVYADMYEEVHGEHVETVTLVRVGKEVDDALQTYTLGGKEREAGGQLFRAALDAYNAKKALKRKK